MSRAITDEELSAHLRRRGTDASSNSDAWHADFRAAVEDELGTPTLLHRTRRSPLPAFVGAAAAVSILAVLVALLPRHSVAPGGSGGTPPATPSAGEPRMVSCAGARVLDETTLVESCELWSTMPAEGADFAISNPDPQVLEVRWAGVCMDFKEFEFRRVEGGYELTAEETIPGSYMICDGVPVAYSLRLELADPVAADSVTFRTVPMSKEPDPTPTPSPTETPVATPQIGELPPTEFIECSDPTAEFGAAIIDTFGLVEGCTTVDAQPGPQVFNPNGSLRRLQLEWGGSPCSAAVGLTFVPGPSGLQIQMGSRPDRRILGGTLPDGTQVCTANAVSHAVRLDLTSPIDASRVSLVESPGSVEPARPVDCGTSVAVDDFTDLVESCVEVEPRMDASGGVVVFNPQADTSRLYFGWMGQDPASCAPGPVTAMLRFYESDADDGYFAASAVHQPLRTGCFDVAREFAVEVRLSEPVSAADVEGMNRALGPIATAKTEVGLFDLAIESDKTIYGPDEPMDISAAIRYSGSAETVDLSAFPIVTFGFGATQLDGSYATLPPMSDAICRTHTLTSGRWMEESGAARNTDWLSDPEKHLPVGTWVVTAYSEFSVGACGASGDFIHLQASMVIVVQ